MIELSLCCKVVELFGENVCDVASVCVMRIGRGTFFCCIGEWEE